MVGPIGTDLYSDFLIKVSDQLGIDSSYLSVVEGYQVPVANAIVDDKGVHTFVSYMPGVKFDSDENILSKLELASGYYLSGYYLVNDHPFMDISMKLMNRAKELGLPVFFDPGPVIGEAPKELVKQVLQYADVISPNETELKVLTGISDPVEAAEYLKEQSNALILAKQGPEGCYVTGENMDGKWYAAFDSPRVDTSGCGDSFLAAFMYGYLEGFDVETCVHLANAAGSVKAGKFGTGRNVPTIAEIITMLEKNGYPVNEQSKKLGKMVNLQLRKR
jgi:sugar/nucleoside kinase (ribokinase family)